MGPGGAQQSSQVEETGFALNVQGGALDERELQRANVRKASAGDQAAPAW